MKKEIDLHRLRLVIRGAPDYLNRDAGDINEALTSQGKVHLVATMDTLEQLCQSKSKRPSYSKCKHTFYFTSNHSSHSEEEHFSYSGQTNTFCHQHWRYIYFQTI